MQPTNDMAEVETSEEPTEATSSPASTLRSRLPELAALALVFLSTVDPTGYGGGGARGWTMV